jgi:hypothetical protein
MRHVGLDYSRFLARDGTEAVAEHLDMIPADISRDGQYRLEDIGGVETAAQTGFDYGDIDLLSSEIIQRKGRDQFKEGEFFFTSTGRWRSMKR